MPLEFGLQMPRFTFPGGPAETRHRLTDLAAGAEDAGLHEPVGHGPLPPDPPGRPALGGHARELDDARLPGRPHRDRDARHARHRRDVPEHRPPGQDRRHPRRAVRRPGRVRHRRRLVRARAPGLRLDRSRRWPTASPSWRTPSSCCRSCGARGRPRTRGARSRWPRRSAIPARSRSTCRSSSAGRASGGRCDSWRSTPMPATCSATPTRCGARSRCSTATARTWAATPAEIAVTVLSTADAPTIEDHVGRYRAYAEAGVHTVIVELPGADLGRAARRLRRGDQRVPDVRSPTASA